MLDHLGSDGQVYNKIGLVLVLRDNANKALKTLRYYLDVPVAKVLFYDIWESALGEEYKEFKRGQNWERALNITPNEGGGYRLSVMNSVDSGERNRLYFQLTRWEARQMAICVLDYLRAHDLASAIAGLMRKEKEEKGGEKEGKEKEGEN